MRPSRKLRNLRRGSEVIEFAMVMPVMIGLLFGAMDYGLYFFERLQVTNALQSSARSGALVKPSDDELDSGGCAECVATVANNAREKVREIGATPRSAISPVLTRVEGICILDIAATFDHHPVIGFVGVPESYQVRVRLPAQAVKEC